MIMDSESALRIRATKSVLLAPSSSLVPRFYETLFQMSPQIRDLFPIDLSEQHRKLHDALALVADHAEDLSRIAEPLRELGRRHMAYGAQTHHYEIVQQAMILAMASAASDVWNDTLDADWRKALSIVVSYMVGQELK